VGGQSHPDHELVEDYGDRRWGEGKVGTSQGEAPAVVDVTISRLSIVPTRRVRGWTVRVWIVCPRVVSGWRRPAHPVVIVVTAWRRSGRIVPRRGHRSAVISGGGGGG
jgi:hypothetical protein